jgi:hypothetical protein
VYSPFQGREEVCQTHFLRLEQPDPPRVAKELPELSGSFFRTVASVSARIRAMNRPEPQSAGKEG